MYYYVILVVIGVVGVCLGSFLAKQRIKSKYQDKASVEKALVKRQEQKEENKNKILQELKKNNRITNDEVQKLLGVSDATATNYMDELGKEGKVEQVGGAEKGTFYQLK